MSQAYHTRASVWAPLTFMPVSAHYSTGAPGVGEKSHSDSPSEPGGREKGQLREWRREDSSLQELLHGGPRGSTDAGPSSSNVAILGCVCLKE